MVRLTKPFRDFTKSLNIFLLTSNHPPPSFSSLGNIVWLFSFDMVILSCYYCVFVVNNAIFGSGTIIFVIVIHLSDSLLIFIEPHNNLITRVWVCMHALHLAYGTMNAKYTEIWEKPNNNNKDKWLSSLLEAIITTTTITNSQRELKWTQLNNFFSLILFVECVARCIAEVK